MRRLRSLTASVLAGGLLALFNVHPASAAYVTVNGQCIATDNGTCTLPATPTTTSPLVIPDSSVPVTGGVVNVTAKPPGQSGVFFSNFSDSSNINFALNPKNLQFQYIGPTLAQALTLNIVVAQNFVVPSGVTTPLISALKFKRAGFAGPGSSISSSNTFTSGANSITLSVGPQKLVASGDFQAPPGNLTTLGDTLTDTIDYAIALGPGTMGGIIVEVAEPAAVVSLGIGLLALASLRRLSPRARSRKAERLSA